MNRVAKGNGMWSRFALNALYNRDVTWLWRPDRELEAVRHGRLVYVKSRSDPLIFYVVDLAGMRCSCPASEHGLKCWHVEAAELGLAAESDTWPAWAYGTRMSEPELPLH